jgi:hypothetical protein
MSSADLLAAAQANGLLGEDGERQCLATIQSGARAGMAHPRSRRPAMIELFDYQAEKVDEVFDLIACGHRRILVVSPRRFPTTRRLV